jgi:hypothetical protein
MRQLKFFRGRTAPIGFFHSRGSKFRIEKELHEEASQRDLYRFVSRMSECARRHCAAPPSRACRRAGPATSRGRERTGKPSPLRGSQGQVCAAGGKETCPAAAKAALTKSHWCDIRNSRGRAGFGRFGAGASSALLLLAVSACDNSEQQPGAFDTTPGWLRRSARAWLFLRRKNSENSHCGSGRGGSPERGDRARGLPDRHPLARP